MVSPDPVAPPAVCRWLLTVAALLAPPRTRAEFRERWDNRLASLCILLDRGEVAGRDRSEMALLCYDALSTAFWLRFSRVWLRHWMLGPQFEMALTVAAGLVLTLASRGFRSTRSVVRAAIESDLPPIPFIGGRQLQDPRSDLVVGAIVPIMLALAIGATLVVIGRLSLGRYGWRYWLFLGFKILSVIALVPLAWIEGSRWLWSISAPELLRAWVAGIGATLAFLAGFGVAAFWIFDDQRRRCPVCLRRLARPVTVGSWGSMFEPVTTEMLCDEGHGTLTMAENEMGEGDRWVSLDASWRGL
jgi:hypothetical protein